MKIFVIFVFFAFVTCRPQQSDEEEDEEQYSYSKEISEAIEEDPKEIEFLLATRKPSTRPPKRPEPTEELYVSKHFYVHSPPEELEYDSRSYDFNTTPRPAYKIFFITLPTPLRNIIPVDVQSAPVPVLASVTPETPVIVVNDSRTTERTTETTSTTTKRPLLDGNSTPSSDEPVKSKNVSESDKDAEHPVFLFVNKKSTGLGKVTDKRDNQHQRNYQIRLPYNHDIIDYENTRGFLRREELLNGEQK